tara:strand:- start:119 stop:490 length:372 start_codon:yes stop_codon:yes gene_type:complete
MAHYAEIDNDNIVQRVIVANEEFIKSGKLGDPSKWIQTSYNTVKGQHQLGGTPLRKNYAGAGSTYDKDRDAFISPQPYPSWILNEDSCAWEAPSPRPEDIASRKLFYYWDEENLKWAEILVPK